MSRGSLPGTKLVRNATRVPGRGVTGTGSRATSVAWALETTLTRRNVSISPMETSITVSAAVRHHGTCSRCTQCAGCISHTSSVRESSGAAAGSSAPRTGCPEADSRRR